jgi:hypothetical protein
LRLDVERIAEAASGETALQQPQGRVEIAPSRLGAAGAPASRVARISAAAQERFGWFIDIASSMRLSPPRPSSC